jgi:cytochrome c5
MKKPYLILVALVLVGCAVTRQLPVPTEDMAKKSGTGLETLRRGHVVYTTECARCHTPMMPKEISGEDWHVVVPGMAWNAGISKADEDAVLKYIMSAQ